VKTLAKGVKMSEKVLAQKIDAYNFDMTSLYEIAINNPPFEFSHIKHGGKSIVFNSPYKLVVSIDDGAFWHTNDELGIVASGKTFDELFFSFFDAFVYAWKAYALEKDSMLAPSGLQVKQSLLAIAKEVN